MSTLRAEIRRIIDEAEGRLTADEVYGQLRQDTTRNNFNVTLCTMVKDRQLTKRKATQAQRRVSPNARLTYGPGRVAVQEGGKAAPKRVMGFMEAKRMREARALRRKAA